MRKLLVILLVVAILMLLAIPYSLDFATSVIPGWHTTIFPSYIIGLIIIVPLIIVAALVYWKRSGKAN